MTDGEILTVDKLRKAIADHSVRAEWSTFEGIIVLLPGEATKLREYITRLGDVAEAATKFINCNGREFGSYGQLRDAVNNLKEEQHGI